MKRVTGTRFVHDVEATDPGVGARRPLRIEQENRRRYVRLEIVSPMWLRRLKDAFGNFTPTEAEPELSGEILNIGAGGVLVELAQPLNEGDIVAMRFRLEGLESLDNVLGLVKRCDHDGAVCLTGIEFVTREHLRDRLSAAELDLLGERAADFNEGVRRVLARYLYTEQRKSLA